MRTTKTALLTLPVPSTAFLDDVLLVYPVGGRLELRFRYEEDQATRLGTLWFDGVAAHRHVTERACTVDHVRDAYDTLVEVRHSEWLAGIAMAASRHGLASDDLHHYLVYVDSMGAYEVVAATCGLFVNDLA